MFGKYLGASLFYSTERPNEKGVGRKHGKLLQLHTAHVSINAHAEKRAIHHWELRIWMTDLEGGSDWN